MGRVAKTADAVQPPWLRPTEWSAAAPMQNRCSRYAPSFRRKGWSVSRGSPFSLITLMSFFFFLFHFEFVRSESFVPRGARLTDDEDDDDYDWTGGAQFDCSSVFVSLWREEKYSIVIWNRDCEIISWLWNVTSSHRDIDQPRFEFVYYSLLNCFFFSVFEYGRSYWNYNLKFLPE